MEYDQNKIKIHVLHCGTIHLQENLTYLAKGVSKKRVQLPVSAYLVEHPIHGNLLIEAGLSADCRALFSPHLNWFYDPHVGKGQTAVEQLADMGLKPEDIDLLLITHNDADHTPEALPRILKCLKDDGYEFVFIRDLILKENYEIKHDGIQCKIENN